MTIIVEKSENCKDIYVRYYTLSKRLYISINDSPYENFDYSTVIKNHDYITFKYSGYHCELLSNGIDYILYINKLG